jgi:excisionase family DNA binding protein
LRSGDPVACTDHKEESFKEVPRSMPTTPSPLQRLEQALETYQRVLEGLECALLKFEEALLELEEEAHGKGAPKRQNAQNLRLLSPTEVSWKLRTDRETVYRMLRSGELPGLKLGPATKVRQADLEEYIKSQQRRHRSLGGEENNYAEG